MKKTKVLNIISSLNPIYGGTSSATIDLAKALSQKNYKIDIVTNDPIRSRFLISNKIKVHNLGLGLGRYNLSLRLYFWLKKNIYKYDKFIFHGIWQFNTVIARILLKNNFHVFTHGQLDPYFASEKFKKIKKQIYWFLIEKSNLKFSKSILLTNENEKKFQNNTFVNTSEIKKDIVNIGVVRPEINKKKLELNFKKKFSYLQKKKYLLFLGRFHKKKGCEILLNSFKKIIRLDKKLYLFMVGPDNEYKKKLINLSNKIGLDNKIIWSTTLLNEDKWSVICNAEAMVLSSHGENFGVSLVEALSVGVPIITTNKVNIHDIIKKTGAGLISNNNVNSFTSTLKKYINLNAKENKNMKSYSTKCFNKYFNLNNNLSSISKILKN